MDWLILADDWGVHPSTTQHLVRNFPATDRVIWVNSIGMRRPQLNLADIKRSFEKLASRSVGQGSTDLQDVDGSAAADITAGSQGLRRFCVLAPKVLPFHLSGPIRAINSRLLNRDVSNAKRALGISKPVAMTVNSAVHLYVDALDVGGLVYLRLDDYSRLPGVDADLIAECEPRMMERADLIICTARSLIPGAWRHKSYYLPQGVDWEHFGLVRHTKPNGRILGFFGLLAEWIDHELVLALARRRPDWQLRFVGLQRYVHPALRQQPNIEILPAVPLEALPSAISDWTAAWIPFEVSELTRAVNPLKLREYLAAGLPTCSTPLPEVVDFSRRSEVCVTSDVEAISSWLDEVVATDSVERRRQRRESVRADGWLQRSNELRRLVAELR